MHGYQHSELGRSWIPDSSVLTRTMPGFAFDPIPVDCLLSMDDRIHIIVKDT